MKKVFFVIFVILLISCTNNKENIIQKEGEVLNIYAIDVFLNKDFYDTLSPIFTDIFKCEINITKYPDALSMLEDYKEHQDSIDVDLLLGLDNTLLFMIEEDSLFLEYESINLNNVPDELIFDKKHLINPFSYSYIAFNYNSYVISDPPITFGEMQDGKFKDQIIMMDPRTTSMGRAMLFWSVVAFGRNGYGHFWRSIKPNIFNIYDNQDDAYNAYLAGEAPIILGLETTPIYHLQQEGIEKYKSTIPQEGGFKLIQGVSIAKKTQKLYLAQKFVDLLLSERIQEMIPTEMWMKPVNRKIELPVDFAILPELSVDYTSKLTTRQTRWQYDSWIAKWKRIMLK